MPDDITLEIATPNGIYTTTVPRTTKVSEVIAAAVEDRQLADGEQHTEGTEQQRRQ